MTAREWLTAHADDVPDALGARCRAAVSSLAAASLASSSDPSDAMADAGVRLLDGVLSSPPMTRAHALDLLAADALLTFAFEAAAADPARLATRADDAMRRIASSAADRSGW